MKLRVVFVDVDDTLMRSAGTKRVPMPSVVAEVRRLKSAGVALYLWSSGGADYALDTAKELNIIECFVGFLPKPDAIIDDQPVLQWRDFRHFYPGQAINLESDTAAAPQGSSEHR